MSINDTDKDLAEIPEGAVDDLEIVLTGDDAPEWFGTSDPGSPAEQLRQSREVESRLETVETATEPDEIKPDIAERIAAANRRAEAAERALQDRETYLEQQLLTTEKHKAQIQREAIKDKIDSIDMRVDQATAALGSAKEQGDHMEEVRITRMLRDLEKARDAYADAGSKVPNDAALDAQFNEYRRTKPRVAPSSDTRSDDGMEPLTATAKKWAQNNSWYKDTKYQGEAAYMMALSNRLAREGMNPDSVEYMDTLTKQLHKRFPDLPVKDLAGRALGQAPARSGGGLPVASARTSASPITTGKNGKIRAEITASDRQMMRSMGLDPTNPEIQKRYAREKIMTRMNERRA